nr:EndoU domain-containing protein [Bacillus cereus group sp. BfR-BA-01383]
MSPYGKGVKVVDKLHDLKKVGDVKKATSGSAGVTKGTGETIKTKLHESEKSLDHANIGDFTRNPKTGETSKMKIGGHGQDNIDFLKQNGIEYNIEKSYPNGVRVGNVPGHKSPGKRMGNGQAWFPENWSKEDIREAGEYVTNNMPEYKDIADGVTIFGDYNGVRIGIIKTNGEIGTVFPDNMLQP